MFDAVRDLQLGLLGGALGSSPGTSGDAPGRDEAGGLRMPEALPGLAAATSASAHFAQRPWWHSLLVVALVLAIVDVALYLAANRSRVRVTSARTLR